VAKVNVYIPDGLLEEVEASALMSGRSRSAVVQEALTEYVTGRKASSAQAERRARMDTALREMDEMAARSPESDNYPDITAGEMVIEARHADADVPVEEIVRRIRARRRQP
jgi:hypothetical protein